jgi:hypothetical protein
MWVTLLFTIALAGVVFIEELGHFQEIFRFLEQYGFDVISGNLAAVPRSYDR